MGDGREGVWSCRGWSVVLLSSLHQRHRALTSDGPSSREWYCFVMAFFLPLLLRTAHYSAAVKIICRAPFHTRHDNVIDARLLHDSRGEGGRDPRT